MEAEAVAPVLGGPTRGPAPPEPRESLRAVSLCLLVLCHEAAPCVRVRPRVGDTKLTLRFHGPEAAANVTHSPSKAQRRKDALHHGCRTEHGVRWLATEIIVGNADSVCNRAQQMLLQILVKYQKLMEEYS